MWIIVISKVTTFSWQQSITIFFCMFDWIWDERKFVSYFCQNRYSWVNVSYYFIILLFLITIVRRNMYTNQNVGCSYFGGTDDGLNLYYVPQVLMYCQFGQMLQQGVNNFCVNNSNIAQNAIYSFCVSRDVQMAIHWRVLLVTTKAQCTHLYAWVDMGQ